MWLYEVVSVLAKAQRNGFLTAEKADRFLKDLRSLNITVVEGYHFILDEVHRLAVQQR